MTTTGYIARCGDGRLAICGRRETAEKLTDTCVCELVGSDLLDHCRLGGPDGVVRFDSKDQSWGRLNSLMLEAEEEAGLWRP